MSPQKKKVKQKLKEGESRLVIENLKNQTHYQILHKIHQSKVMLQKIINNKYIYIYIQRERERERE